MKETFYFSHDYNSRNDEKIRKIIRKFKMEWYWVYWCIVEDLYQNANALQMDSEGIAFDYHTTENLVDFLINESWLFELNDWIISSKSVWRRLEERDKRSSAAREKANKRWKGKNATALQQDCKPNAVKESKGKESKGNNINYNIKESKDSKELALKKNPDIDLLISELKTEADRLWIAYDNKSERNFWKHITKAKEFGNFCEKIWMERIEFAKNIMKASIAIKFWKWTCSWPMSIYQNYSEVYNKTKEQSESIEIINIT